MPRIPVKTKALPTRGPYSYIVEARPKKLLFVSGLLAVDGDGKPVGEGDMKAQVKQIVSNLQNILRDAGATLRDVVRLNICTTNIELFRNLGEWRSNNFPDLWSYDQRAPASTAVGVAALAASNFLVEIEATAALD